MKHIDLFSGIGGFALAIDRVFGESEHIFVENDLFCQEVLKKHYPNSKIYGDIRSFTSDADSFGHIHRQPKKQSTKKSHEAQCESSTSTESPSILTGGFPCQPFSHAGRRKGTSDNRYLWPEMFRVIRDWKPTYIIAENVRGLVTWNDGMVLEQVCLDLENEGYEVQPIIVPAVAVNAPHRRDRVWFIAYRKDTKWRAGQFIKKVTSVWASRNDKSSGIHCNNTDSTNKGLERGKSNRQRFDRQSCGNGCDERRDWDKNWIEVATSFCRVDDGFPRRLDRNPRLKALGNAIVPQVAEMIMQSIKNTYE